MANNDVIRSILALLGMQHAIGEHVTVRGLKTVELLNQTITFDGRESGLITLPGFSTSERYVEAEFEWYNSASNKSDFISKFAAMWDVIANERGFVNSNYGHLVYSPQNCNQYDNVVKELKNDPQSRRAVMVYCPNHIHYTGGNDYVCTMYTSYTVRNNKLQAFVSMRSSDLRYGIVGADLAWQTHILHKLCNDLGYEPGNIHWHACSLHLYERHFNAFDLL